MIYIFTVQEKCGCMGGELVSACHFLTLYKLITPIFWPLYNFFFARRVILHDKHCEFVNVPMKRTLSTPYILVTLILRYIIACLSLSVTVGQKLEEAAATAAEEERRRLQTQHQLEDHYRAEMEKEKMVFNNFCTIQILLT